MIECCIALTCYTTFCFILAALSNVPSFPLSFKMRWCLKWVLVFFSQAATTEEILVPSGCCVGYSWWTQKAAPQVRKRERERERERKREGGREKERREERAREREREGEERQTEGGRKRGVRRERGRERGRVRKDRGREGETE